MQNAGHPLEMISLLYKPSTGQRENYVYNPLALEVEYAEWTEDMAQGTISKGFPSMEKCYLLR